MLVTGATGFLGGAVARRLLQEGRAVRATGRNARRGAALTRLGAAFYQADLARDTDTLAVAIRGCDAVVHCAALSSAWGPRHAFVASNVTATAHVVEACRAADVRRLVHISTPSVSVSFEDCEGVDEAAPWPEPPATPYVGTKRIAEQLVSTAAQEGLEVVVLRPRALFGPGDTTLIPRLLRVTRSGSFPLPDGRDPLLDMTWIGDGVDAVCRAMDAPTRRPGGVYNISSGDPQRLSRVVSAFLAGFGRPVRFRTVPLARALRLAGSLEWISRRLLGGRWEPPLTRFGVAQLTYSLTLDLRAAGQHLGYRPTTDVLARLEETGRMWADAP